MPDLPTITVTAAQADRILAAYKGIYGVNTPGKAVKAYKHDITRHINRTVIEYEDSLLIQQQHDERAAKMIETAEELPAPEHPEPPPPEETVPPETPPPSPVPPDSIPPVPDNTLPDAVVEVTK